MCSACLGKVNIRVSNIRTGKNPCGIPLFGSMFSPLPALQQARILAALRHDPGVRQRDGKALEVRKPLLEESTGGRFKDAFLKVKKRPKEVDEKITAARQKEKEGLRGADDFLKQALARAKESDEKPVNPLDQD